MNINPFSEQAYLPIVCGSGLMISEQMRAGIPSEEAFSALPEDKADEDNVPYKKLKLARSFPKWDASERRRRFSGESCVSKVKWHHL